MSQRNWLRAVLMASCAAVAGSAQDAPKPDAPMPAQAAAPAAAPETFKVEAHQSRWDYPKEVTLTGEQKLHIVKPGDTFWALAAHYLGNPHAWPQIWDLNKWVKDPHWIYPGDPLIVDGSRAAIGKADAPEAVAATEPKTETADLAPTEVADITPELTTVPARTRALNTTREELAFGFQDFLQLPYLAPKGAEAAYKSMNALHVVGAKDSTRKHFADGDTIYLDGGQNRGMKVGDRFLLLKTVARNLVHPTDPTQHHTLGDVVQQVGVIRATVIHSKGSVAVIERALDSVELGDAAVTFTEPSNMVLKLRTDVEEPIQLKDMGRVVYVRDRKQRAGGGDMIVVDKGSADGVQVGDLLLMVDLRSFPVTEHKVASRREMEKTNHYIGQAIVVRTNDTTATCRVVRSVREVSLGDVVTR